MITGGFAEYAVAPEHALALKPAELSFAQASTLPQSGAIAVQAVARAKPRSRMLINGAGGGTGAFALQLAAAAGIHVTGVDNAGKLDFMRSLGADEVIDYRAEDFTRGGLVRPDRRPRRPALGVRVPTCAGARRQVPDRRRDDARAAAGADGRRGDRRTHGSASRAAGGQARTRAVRAARAVLRRRVGAHPHRPRLRLGARCRRRSRTSARVRRSARSWC